MQIMVYGCVDHGVQGRTPQRKLRLSRKHINAGKILCGLMKLSWKCLGKGQQVLSTTTSMGKKMNSQVYQSVLQDNVRVAVDQIKLSGI